jgi:hypothetical protein
MIATVVLGLLFLGAFLATGNDAAQAAYTKEQKEEVRKLALTHAAEFGRLKAQKLTQRGGGQVVWSLAPDGVHNGTPKTKRGLLTVKSIVRVVSERGGDANGHGTMRYGINPTTGYLELLNYKWEWYVNHNYTDVRTAKATRGEGPVATSSAYLEGQGHYLTLGDMMNATYRRAKAICKNIERSSGTWVYMARGIIPVVVSDPKCWVDEIEVSNGQDGGICQTSKLQLYPVGGICDFWITIYDEALPDPKRNVDALTHCDGRAGVWIDPSTGQIRAKLKKLPVFECIPENAPV